MLRTLTGLSILMGRRESLSPLVRNPFETGRRPHSPHTCFLFPVPQFLALLAVYNDCAKDAKPTRHREVAGGKAQPLEPGHFEADNDADADARSYISDEALRESTRRAMRRLANCEGRAACLTICRFKPLVFATVPHAGRAVDRPSAKAS